MTDNIKEEVQKDFEPVLKKLAEDQMTKENKTELEEAVEWASFIVKCKKEWDKVNKNVGFTFTDGNNRLKTLIHHAQASIEKDEWQDISSAPRDGTEIVVFSYLKPSDWCKHLYPVGIPTVSVVMWSTVFKGWTDGSQSHPDYNPTHWMPLPTPPKTNSEEG